MMRKTSLLFLGALAGILTTLLITQPRALLVGSAARAAVSDTYRELNLFGDVFERVRADYVERPDDSKLVESAIIGMLAGLDPHSSYMDPKSFRDMQVQTRGEFGGSDGLGGTQKGLSIAARSGGEITAPCDGWVVYAGRFRSYGQLLNLNAGGGYHVLLAGMER